MFINNINPTIFKFSFLEIRWYGIVYLFGFILAYIFLRKNKDKLKLTNADVDNIIFYIFLGMLIGARIFHFLFNDPVIFITDPLELFKIWHGGMSFFGAFLGMSMALSLYSRKNKKSFLGLADLIVIPAAIALIFGRIANFINSELIGRISSLPWCVVFQKVDDVCRHPYQIYASISHVILLVALLYLRRLKLKDGMIFYWFIFIYSILRFVTDFFRLDPMFFGLTNWQWLSLGFAVITGYIIVRRK